MVKYDFYIFLNLCYNDNYVNSIYAKKETKLRVYSQHFKIAYGGFE